MQNPRCRAWTKSCGVQWVLLNFSIQLCPLCIPGTATCAQSVQLLFSPAWPAPGWDCPPGGSWLATPNFQLPFQMRWALPSFGAAPELPAIGVKSGQGGSEGSHMESIFSEEESPALFPKLTGSRPYCAPAGWTRSLGGSGVDAG